VPYHRFQKDPLHDLARHNRNAKSKIPYSSCFQNPLESMMDPENAAKATELQAVGVLWIYPSSLFEYLLMARTDD